MDRINTYAIAAINEYLADMATAHAMEISQGRKDTIEEQVAEFLRNYMQPGQEVEVWVNYKGELLASVKTPDGTWN